MAHPENSWVNLTTSCDNRCLGCYADNICNHDTEPHMPIESVLMTIEHIKNIGCERCILIGGEPTLHPDLAEVIKFGNKIKLKLSLVTNGQRFADEDFCTEMVSAGLKQCAIAFSLHTPSDQESFNFTGNTSAFSRFRQGVVNLIQYNIHPVLNVVLLKPLVLHIEKVMKFIMDDEIKSVNFITNAPIVGQTVDDSILYPDESAEAVWKIFQLSVKTGVRANFLFHVPFCLLERSKMEELLQAGVLRYGCHLAQGTGVVFAKNGDLTACNQVLDKIILPAREILSILQRGDFPDFWNSEKMNDLRKMVYAYRSPHCVDCEWWNICGGGHCPLPWFRFDPQKYIKGLQKR